jgi:hypothetical protein
MVGVEKQQVETGKYIFRKGGISFSDQKISNYEKFLCFIKSITNISLESYGTYING